MRCFCPDRHLVSAQNKDHHVWLDLEIISWLHRCSWWFFSVLVWGRSNNRYMGYRLACIVGCSFWLWFCMGIMSGRRWLVWSKAAVVCVLGDQCRACSLRPGGMWRFKQWAHIPCALSWSLLIVSVAFSFNIGTSPIVSNIAEYYNVMQWWIGVTVVK